jgi:hypothetical protein
MGNCSSQSLNIKLVIQNSLAKANIFLDKYKYVDGDKAYYYVPGKDLPNIPFGNDINKLTTFGNVWQYHGQAEKFSIVCFINGGKTDIHSYLGHVICTFKNNMQIPQISKFKISMDFQLIYSYPLEKDYTERKYDLIEVDNSMVENNKKLYVNYLDTRIDRTTTYNKYTKIGTGLINVLKNKHIKFTGFDQFSYIYLSPLDTAYTFYIKERLRPIVYNIETNKYNFPPVLWKENEQGISYIQDNECLKLNPNCLQEHIIYCNTQIKIAEDEFKPQVNAFMSSFTGTCIYFMEKSGGMSQKKVLYKSYYYKVRSDSRGNFIFSDRIGRVPLSKIRKNSHALPP